jgi:predicted lipase
MKVYEMSGTCSTLGRDEKCIQNFSRKSEGKRPLGRHWSRWEDNIRMDVREIGWEVVGWINVALDRDQRRELVNTVIDLRVP